MYLDPEFEDKLKLCSWSTQKTHLKIATYTFNPICKASRAMSHDTFMSLSKGAVKEEALEGGVRGLR